MNLDRSKDLVRIQRIKMAAFLSLLLIILLVFVLNKAMFVSAILAVLISYLLAPVVNAIERLGLERSMAVIIAFLTLTVFFGLTIAALEPLIVSQFASLRGDMPKYISEIHRIVEEAEEGLRRIVGTSYDLSLSARLTAFLGRIVSGFINDLTRIISSSLTVLILAPLFAFFILRDGQRFKRLILDLVPNHWFELILNLFHQINVQIGNFMRARLIEAAAVGLIVFIGLLIFRFPYAALLAIFAALTNLIPYLGPVIGFVPAMVILLTNEYSSVQIVAVSSAYAAAQIIDTVFIIPVILAKLVDLHPITVLLAFLIGTQLMGAIGMIISIPLTSALKVTVQTVYRHLIDYRQ